MIINLHIDEQDGEGYISDMVELNVIPEIGDKLLLSASAIALFQTSFEGYTNISLENRTVEIIDKYISVKSRQFDPQTEEMVIFAKLVEPIDELKF